eukprot:TRINITY_DN493_c0_g3_i1.p1 TRINITY_DN493_c0_g3~~TRINITY_DN493_c0_g3_i1.p1  ORF type:complete len:279 (-),score=41.02 TRINITY_DN493_c0_g3_i1:84-920(-)
MVSLRCVVVLFTLVAVATSISIGDRLVRTYTKYVTLPTTIGDAVNQGWQTAGDCDTNLGVAYNYQSNGPQVDSPLTIYFTGAGQVAGVGIEVYGSLPDNLISFGAWQEVVQGQQYHLSVSFRSSGAMCSTSPSTYPLGDRLVVNADTLKFSLPTTSADADSANWFRGSCFAGMGHHYFYDIATAPSMSWQAKNLFPVVTMFNGTDINAIFFASPTVQQSLFDAHWWEPIALLDALMCKNWCDPSCTFSDTSLWSTFHVYFRDHNNVYCDGGCSTACCP